MKNIFVEGAISASFIAESISKHSSKKGIGAHAIFLGQVRNDVLQDSVVKAIEYSCYQEMALEKMHHIREDIFEKYALTCLHVYHSVGTVLCGEICLYLLLRSTEEMRWMLVMNW